MHPLILPLGGIKGGETKPLNTLGLGGLALIPQTPFSQRFGEICFLMSSLKKSKK
jgi:hypothetical protein